jgi:DNA repair protein RadC
MRFIDFFVYRYKFGIIIDANPRTARNLKDKPMSIKDWPADERPREKLLQRGANALTDAELLAIFLRTGVTGKSAVDMAKDLLIEFGSLQALLSAEQTRFCASHGLGQAKYVQLQAVLEMARRHFAEILQRGNALTSPDITRAYLSAQLRGLGHEVFACLFLDNQHRVIAWEELFRGTIDGASVYPREVAKRALRHNAAAIIFAHNHPSGVSEPSQADRHITEKLRQALNLFDIRVLDHFIVGDGQPYSFAEHGLL